MEPGYISEMDSQNPEVQRIYNGLPGESRIQENTFTGNLKIQDTSFIKF